MPGYHYNHARLGAPQRRPLTSLPHQRRSRPGRRKIALCAGPRDVDMAPEKHLQIGFIVALPVALALWGGIAAIAHAAF